MTQERVYVDLPAVDYLTTTTYYQETFKYLRSLAFSISDGDRAEGRVMQYAGDSGVGYFAGSAMQSGTEHFMVRTSGAFAHDYAMLTHEATAGIRAAKASRVDVQVSVVIGAGDARLAEVGVQLQEGKFGAHRRRGQRMKVNVIRGEDGFDTIYIGTRSSPRFIRIYCKEVAGVRYVRFEVEFKEDLAKQAWNGVRLHGSASLGPLLRAELDSLPLGFVNALGGVYEATGEAEGQRLRAAYGDATWEKQLRWTRKQVAPTLEKLLASPAREEVCKLLRDLLENY